VLQQVGPTAPAANHCRLPYRSPDRYGMGYYYSCTDQRLIKAVSEGFDHANAVRKHVNAKRFFSLPAESVQLYRLLLFLPVRCLNRRYRTYQLSVQMTSKRIDSIFFIREPRLLVATDGTPYVRTHH